ncbi:hypothetical protein X727_14250 [Mesorhizobium sp. L103C119B0]|nr:hypothetical protein X727_14250 [Mesorhizobium sp. L103C119B0]
MVVNSGGGEVLALLTGAGVKVPVMEVGRRLFVGAARNLGIAATKGLSLPFLPMIASPVRAGPRHGCSGIWLATAPWRARW